MSLLSTEIADVKNFLLNLQNRIIATLETEENQPDSNKQFVRDEWVHQSGGGGLTCVLNDGRFIEKAGVNFSHVFGDQLPQAATIRRPDLKQARFQALGVSVVVHPCNPYAPTCHMNVRFISIEKENNEHVWWFGGGFDLTPYYGFEEDCIHWHQTAKAACEPFGSAVYPKYKKWCDDYFYLKHRSEPRGIGGLFFDDLSEWGFDQSFSFIQSVGNHFIKAYQPILSKRKTHPYDDAHRLFQLYRRGRYVEFNLLYDRGTLFGLQSNGRTESILMSLPPLVAWHYDKQFDSESQEARLYSDFLRVRDWV